MENRNKLITYALMCNGDYMKIKKMILECPEVENLAKGVEAITILDDDYPKELFQMKYPPFVLFKDGITSCVPNKEVDLGKEYEMNDEDDSDDDKPIIQRILYTIPVHFTSKNLEETIKKYVDKYIGDDYSVKWDVLRSYFATPTSIDSDSYQTALNFLYDDVAMHFNEIN